VVLEILHGYGFLTSTRPKKANKSAHRIERRHGWIIRRSGARRSGTPDSGIKNDLDAKNHSYAGLATIFKDFDSHLALCLIPQSQTAPGQWPTFESCVMTSASLSRYGFFFSASELMQYRLGECTSQDLTRSLDLAKGLRDFLCAANLPWKRNDRCCRAGGFKQTGTTTYAGLKIINPYVKRLRFFCVKLQFQFVRRAILYDFLP